MANEFNGGEHLPQVTYPACGLLTRPVCGEFAAMRKFDENEPLADHARRLAAELLEEPTTSTGEARNMEIAYVLERLAEREETT